MAWQPVPARRRWPRVSVEREQYTARNGCGSVLVDFSSDERVNDFALLREMWEMPVEWVPSAQYHLDGLAAWAPRRRRSRLLDAVRWVRRRLITL